MTNNLIINRVLFSIHLKELKQFEFQDSQNHLASNSVKSLKILICKSVTIVFMHFEDGRSFTEKCTAAHDGQDLYFW